MKSMKAIMFHKLNDMTLETVPIPQPEGNQVLIKVKACGICGTDPHILHGVWPGGFPLIPGHEASGEVVELGAAVKSLKIGDRVTVDPNVSCGYCEFCQKGEVHFCKNLKPFGVFAPGGFAEYAVIAETHAIKIPDNMTYEEAAMLEPAACCLRGAQMAKYKTGCSVLVLGVGAIGNMNMQFARNCGASMIIVSDPIAGRRELALQLGADYAIDPMTQDLYSEVNKLLPDGPDVILECAGKTLLVEEAIKHVSRGGTVIAFGVCPADEYAKFSPAYINDNEITICGSYNNPFTQFPSIQAISSGRINVKPLISHRYKLDEYKEAFDVFGSEGSLKIMIIP